MALVCGFFIVTVLIIGVGRKQYVEEEIDVTREWGKTLSTVGALKADQIAEWRRDRLADVNRYALGPSLVSAAQTLLREPANADKRKALQYMLKINRKGGVYQNALLFSPSGELLASAVSVTDPLQDTTRLAVQSSSATRKPVFSAIYRTPSGNIFIDVTAPIFDEHGKITTIFLLRSDVSTSLYPLIHFWPDADNHSVETFLVRREGEFAVFLNNVRDSTQSALALKTPLTLTTHASTQAVLGTRGIFEGLDYRNTRIVSDIRPIPDSDWLLISKVDKSEIEEEVRLHALVIVRFIGLTIFLAALLLALGYGKRQVRLYRDLYRMEKQQRQAQANFKTILYSIGDGVIVTDARAHVCQMNPIAETLTGWKESDAVGKPVDTIFRTVNADTRQALEDPVSKVLKEGHIAGLTNHTFLISKTGEERPIADSGAPVLGEQGGIDGVVLVFRDQTAEYAAQKALRESESQYSDLFRNMAEGFALHEIICDAQGQAVDFRILKVNTAFERITGLTAERAMGNTLTNLFPNIAATWVKIYAAILKENKAVCFEGDSIINKHHFRITAFSPRSGQLCAIFDDISEERKSAEMRKMMEGQLQQSQRLEAIGRLAGGVAHDFNNMLTVIIGNAELAKARIDDLHPVSADLSEIIKAGQRSADLIRQLLAFASRQTVTPQILNLNDVISPMLSVLRKIIADNVTLEWVPDQNLWAISMDASQIDQILVNLTVNARDAIRGTGKMTLATQNVHMTDHDCKGIAPNMCAGDFVLLSVTDTGIGMDKELQAHAFEPFYTTQQLVGGTGLGLATVYGVVRQNNGFIHLSSAPEKGTRFDIYLPRHTGAVATATPTEPTGSAGGGSETILVVEDEPALLNLTCSLLKTMGYTVLSAATPREAILLSERVPDTIHLLLTDVVMPEMSGIELWAHLRQKRPEIKRLFISGYASDRVAQYGVSESIEPFLQKPFTTGILAAKLRMIFSASDT